MKKATTKKRTPSSDLAVLIKMFTERRIDHRFWALRHHSDDPTSFDGTCLVVGSENDGPYVQMTFDLTGTLVDFEPTHQDFDPAHLWVARTGNNHTEVVDLLAPTKKEN